MSSYSSLIRRSSERRRTVRAAPRGALLLDRPGPARHDRKEHVVDDDQVPPTFPVRFADGSVRECADGGYVDLETEDVRLPDGTRITDALVDEWVRAHPAAQGRPLPDDGA